VHRSRRQSTNNAPSLRSYLAQNKLKAPGGVVVLGKARVPAVEVDLGASLRSPRTGARGHCARYKIWALDVVAGPRTKEPEIPSTVQQREDEVNAGLLPASRAESLSGGERIVATSCLARSSSSELEPRKEHRRYIYVPDCDLLAPEPRIYGCAGVRSYLGLDHDTVSFLFWIPNLLRSGDRTKSPIPARNSSIVTLRWMKASRRKDEGLK
jgi:hypothetical protein